jgi:hypothetical protein
MSILEEPHGDSMEVNDMDYLVLIFKCFVYDVNLACI